MRWKKTNEKYGDDLAAKEVLLQGARSQVESLKEEIAVFRLQCEEFVGKIGGRRENSREEGDDGHGPWVIQGSYAGRVKANGRANEEKGKAVEAISLQDSNRNNAEFENGRNQVVRPKTVGVGTGKVGNRDNAGNDVERNRNGEGNRWVNKEMSQRENKSGVGKWKNGGNRVGSVNVNASGASANARENGTAPRGGKEKIVIMGSSVVRRVDEVVMMDEEVLL